jgi:hypothetical protein
VDAAHAGSELGTEALPFNTLAEGVVALRSGGTLRVKGNTGRPKITERPRITKAMRLVASGGVVRIGDLSAPAGGGMSPVLTEDRAETGRPEASGSGSMDTPVALDDTLAQDAADTQMHDLAPGMERDNGLGSTHSNLDPPEGTHPISGAGPAALALLTGAMALLMRKRLRRK